MGKVQELQEPITDRCPACGRRGLEVIGSRATGQIHRHTKRGAPELGIPGGCGYIAAWKPSTFKRETPDAR